MSAPNESNADIEDEKKNITDLTLRTEPDPPQTDINFTTLPWNLNLPNLHSYIHLTTTTTWSTEHYDPQTSKGTLFSSLHPYADTPLNLHPSTTSLNYGTTIWEGLKCYRTSPTTAVVFRPDQNYQRFVRGAEALCLPPPSYELFMSAIQLVVRANSTLIPPVGEGTKLYIRPILFGSGQQLGLHPSPQFSLLFYVSPTGSYFQSKPQGLKLHLETTYSRAAKGGLGNVKCSGNYGSTLRPLNYAKAGGFDDNLYLEMDTYNEKGTLDKAIIQELSAANIFLVLQSGEIVTPSLDRGTILPGVTRSSILTLANEYKDELRVAMMESTGNQDVQVTISERDVTVSEFHTATEAFVTGTAAEIVPIASIGTNVKREEEAFHVELKFGKELPGGPVTSKLLCILREVMIGKKERRSCDKTSGWLKDPFGTSEEFCL